MVQERETVIIDANVLYSALYKPEGVCGRIAQAATQGLCQLFAPDSVREEVRRNLAENLSMSVELAVRLVTAMPVEWIPREVYENKIDEAASLLAHIADSPVLAASLSLQLPVLTGDKHFYSKQVTRRVKVLTPTHFLSKLRSR